MLPPLNFQQWIADNRHLLRPPVANKVLFKNADMIVMVVGGPNARRDYHVNTTPEFFYQLEGTLTLKVMDESEPRDIVVEAGQVYMLPAGVPHSPQRSEGSIGLVVEMKRAEGALDELRFYCDSCRSLIYAESFVLQNIETQFPPIFDRFYGEPAKHTCPSCGWVTPPRG